MIKVGIVDSGVNMRLLHMYNKPIKGCSLRIVEGMVECQPEFCDNIGHGTSVYYIVNKIVDSENVDVYNIKIYDNDVLLNQNEFQLIMKYIYDNFEFNIINISMGLVRVRNLQNLNLICKKFYMKGTLLVSAFDNLGAISFPAAFAHVLGVDTSEKVTDEKLNIRKGIVNIIGKCKHYKVPWGESNFILVQGNSYFCGEVTALIANKFVKQPDYLQTIMREIVYENSENNEFMNNVHKAAIFPFNKEIHSIALNEDLLNFEVVQYYSIKYSGLTNTRISSSFPYINNLKVIKNIDEFNTDEIDTLIIGHCEEILKATGIDYRTKLVNRCMENNIKVYSFDDQVLSIDNIQYSNVYVPAFKKEKIWLRQGKLFKTNIPILGVIGTSSAQGKFSLQLSLRKKLIERGYSVGQLGTEPSSILFDFDEGFPIGYNSSINLSNSEMILAVNQMIWNISQKDVEIIIAGGQSGLVAVDDSNLNRFGIRHQIFFQAISPDGILICINPYDSIKLIDRTIKAAEGLSQGKVLGIVCFPMDIDLSWRGLYGKRMHINPEKVTKLKSEIKKHFDIKMYMLDSSDELDELVEHIIDFFSN